MTHISWMISSPWHWSFRWMTILFVKDLFASLFGLTSVEPPFDKLTWPDCDSPLEIGPTLGVGPIFSLTTLSPFPQDTFFIIFVLALLVIIRSQSTPQPRPKPTNFIPSHGTFAFLIPFPSTTWIKHSPVTSLISLSWSSLWVVLQKFLSLFPMDLVPLINLVLDCWQV